MRGSMHGIEHIASQSTNTRIITIEIRYMTRAHQVAREGRYGEEALRLKFVHYGYKTRNNKICPSNIPAPMAEAFSVPLLTVSRVSISVVSFFRIPLHVGLLIATDLRCSHYRIYSWCGDVM
jgi:hypothetical protein